MRSVACALLLLCACNPRSFDDFLPGQGDASFEEAGTPARDAGRDASKPRDASLDAMTATDAGPPSPPVDAAVPAYDASITMDATIPDSGMRPRDGCGQIPPSSLAQTGIEGATFPGAIMESSAVQARALTDMTGLGARYWWFFQGGFAKASLAVANTDSTTFSTIDSPYTLAESRAGAAAPVSFLPTLDVDRDALRPNEQLMHLTGSMIATGLTDGLLFYSVGGVYGGAADGGIHIRTLGTRVAKVHADLGGAVSADVVPAMLFGADAQQFRFGLRDGDFIYLYACPASDDNSSYDCYLARSPINQATTSAGYQFRVAGGWSNDVRAATRVITNARDIISISNNPYLQRFVAVHLLWISSTLRIQTALRPEGPWEVLGDVELPPPEGPNQISHLSAIEQPELVQRCGRTLVVTYLHARDDDLGGSELRRVEVTLKLPPQ